jgi:pteridine reductase
MSNLETSTSLPAAPPDLGLALVTGAGRRIGKAIAIEMGRLGYTVGVHYFHSAPEAAALVVELNDLGVRAHALQADLNDPAQVERLFAQVADLPEPLSVLINSAAVMPAGNLRDLSLADWESTLNLNLRAPFLCAQWAARLMRAGSVIINISDTGARKTWTRYPAYTLSKAGLETLTRLLARELAPAIRVNAVAPGFVLPQSGTDPAVWQSLIAKVPMRRAAEPQEIAGAVAFLVQNPYITGQILTLDGGYQNV